MRGKWKNHSVKVALAGCLVALASGVTALAYSYNKTSGGDVEQHFVTQTVAAIIPNTPGWHDIPNSTISVTVPNSNTSHRLAHMTFSAESRCTDATRCSVRAIVTSAEDGNSFELEPAAGTNFTFDSGGQRGARSFSRMTVLTGGGEGIQYTFKLQGQVIGATATSEFRLDDYLTHLELSNTPIQ